MRIANLLLAALLAGATALASAEPTLPAYGQQLFTGQFRDQSFSGLNEGYLIATGDKISLRLWGASTVEDTVTVDAQGNIFVPNVGPVQVLGVRNDELNAVVTKALARTYRAGVGAYATLATMQPVKLFVTGAVVKPGVYTGVSADSVLKFLDAAGGIASTGSYVDVKLLRAGKERQHYDLTRFLRLGELPWVQLADGDVLLVGNRRPEVRVEGLVGVPARYEIDDNATVADVLALARPEPSANTVLIERNAGASRERLALALPREEGTRLVAGDALQVTSDKHLSQVNVRIEGAHLGAFNIVLPYGATLAQALEQIRPDARSRLKDLQLFRRSVAASQTAALQTQIEALQATALSTRSLTSEEAALKAKDAELLVRFVENLRAVKPVGQVVLKGVDPARVLLEEGDTLRIPRESSLVTVHGDALFGRAVAWREGITVANVLEQVGGLSMREDDVRAVRVALSGEAREVDWSAALDAGDEVFVLPKVRTHSVEVTRGITQILYQTAVAARVLVGLF
jgi:protein involved in polysaccharide export with SLBB domain